MFFVQSTDNRHTYLRLLTFLVPEEHHNRPWGYHLKKVPDGLLEKYPMSNASFNLFCCLNKHLSASHAISATEGTFHQNLDPKQHIWSPLGYTHTNRVQSCGRFRSGPIIKNTIALYKKGADTDRFDLKLQFTQV